MSFSRKDVDLELSIWIYVFSGIFTSEQLFLDIILTYINQNENLSTANILPDCSLRLVDNVQHRQLDINCS